MIPQIRSATLAAAFTMLIVAGTTADDGVSAKDDVPAETPSAVEEADADTNAKTVKEGAGKAPAGEASDDTDAESTPEEPTEDEVDEAAFLQDPFSYLQSDMQSATVDLKDGATTPPATVTQPRILKHLGMLIQELEKQGAGAGQAGQRVNRPAQQSSLMAGPGGQNEMRAPRDDGRDWADLTPQERQKILQSKTDGFPAGYDDILADYFRRLARAQNSDVLPSANDGDTTSQPTEGPSN